MKSEYFYYLIFNESHIYLFYIVQHGTGAHPASCPVPGALSTEGKPDGMWTLRLWSFTSYQSLY